METATTGISWLDNLIGNGIPKNRITMVSGDSGVGKSVFTYHYIKEGLYNDERVAVLTTSSNSDLVLDDLTGFIGDISWAIEQDRLKIISVKNYLEGLLGSENKESVLINFFKEIEAIISKYNIDRIVVDPILPFEFNSDLGTSFNYIGKLVEFFSNQKLNVTTVITCANSFGANSELLEQLVSGVIKMNYEQSDNEMKRVLWVKKMKTVSYQNKRIFFDIIKNEGMIIA